MINTRKLTTARLAAVCSLLVFSNLVVFSQAQQMNDAEQIKEVMKRLSGHLANAEDLVDPKLSGQERKKSLGHFGDPTYQLTLIPTDGIRIQPDGHAVVPARVHFKTSTQELDANVEVKFVQRNGVWYFANFDFLGWPAVLVAVLIIGIGVGIAFAAVVLILRSRLRKQGKLKGANLIKIFVPIFWPKLFSESRPSA